MAGSLFLYLSTLLILLAILPFCVFNFLDVEALELSNSGKAWRSLGKLESKSFLFYKNYIYHEQACKCMNTFSCDCCQMVTLVQSRAQKLLCAKFMYQRGGLKVETTLDSMVVKTMTITNYRPHRICSLIPGALFSSVCVNIVELNAFAKSLTVCPIIELTTKTQGWKLSYTCVSISTDLMSMAMTQMAGGGAMMSGAVIVAPGPGTSPMQAQLILLPAGTNLAGQMVSTMRPMTTMGTGKPPGASGMIGATVPPSGSQMKPPGMSTMGQGMNMTKPGNVPAGVMPPSTGAQVGMTTSVIPLSQTRQSPIELDKNDETIILYSPESNNRSKYFPSRTPPAYMTNETSLELQ